MLPLSVPGWFHDAVERHYMTNPIEATLQSAVSAVRQPMLLGQRLVKEADLVAILHVWIERCVKPRLIVRNVDACKRDHTRWHLSSSARTDYLNELVREELDRLSGHSGPAAKRPRIDSESGSTVDLSAVSSALPSRKMHALGARYMEVKQIVVDALIRNIDMSLLRIAECIVPPIGLDSLEEMHREVLGLRAQPGWFHRLVSSFPGRLHAGNPELIMLVQRNAPATADKYRDASFVESALEVWIYLCVVPAIEWRQRMDFSEPPCDTQAGGDLFVLSTPQVRTMLLRMRTSGPGSVPDVTELGDVFDRQIVRKPEPQNPNTAVMRALADSLSRNLSLTRTDLAREVFEKTAIRIDEEATSKLVADLLRLCVKPLWFHNVILEAGPTANPADETILQAIRDKLPGEMHMKRVELAIHVWITFCTTPLLAGDSAACFLRDTTVGTRPDPSYRLSPTQARAALRWLSTIDWSLFEA